MNVICFPENSLNVEFSGRITDFLTELDNGGGAGQDDPNHETEGTESYVRMKTHLDMWDQKLQNTLSFSLVRYDRDTVNGTDNEHPYSLTDSSFESDRVKIDWQSVYNGGGRHMVTVGLETEKESGNSSYYSESLFGPFRSDFDEQDSRISSVYFQDQIKMREEWFLTLGLRHDDHSEFGSESNFQFSSIYAHKDLGLKWTLSYGTGFKAPTIYQLFSQYGFSDLVPEESEGFDMGLAKTFFDEKFYMGVTYFYNDIEDLIDFDSPSSRYMNVNRAVTEGFEFESRLMISEAIFLGFNYTLTETENKGNGNELFRRPKHKASFNAGVDVRKNVHVEMTVRYTGERRFQDFSTFPAGIAITDDFWVADISLNFELNSKCKFFARVENIFDEEYQEVIGYGTQSLSGYAGVQYKFL